MIKCKICGSEMVPTIDKHYIARDKTKTGLAVLVSNDEMELYDAFDCPTCGCQIVAQERKRHYSELTPAFDFDDEDVDEDADDAEECDGES